jgi:hypothetical protein
MRQAKYPIGTKFKTRGKNPRVYTVSDILKTYNNSGELVQIRYIAYHEFMGQLVYDRDIVETTIAMGLIDENNGCVNN